LISWGWTRTDALAFIADVTGISWQKSACTMCPFHFSSRAGLPATLQRYHREPDAGADALYLEAVSLAFNERIGLLAKGRLVDAVREADRRTPPIPAPCRHLRARPLRGSTRRPTPPWHHPAHRPPGTPSRPRQPLGHASGVGRLSRPPRDRRARPPRPGGTSASSPPQPRSSTKPDPASTPCSPPSLREIWC
jgi:hypothetical protein